MLVSSDAELVDVSSTVFCTLKCNDTSPCGGITGGISVYTRDECHNTFFIVLDATVERDEKTSLIPSFCNILIQIL